MKERLSSRRSPERSQWRVPVAISDKVRDRECRLNGVGQARFVSEHLKSLPKTGAICIEPMECHLVSKLAMEVVQAVEAMNSARCE